MKLAITLALAAGACTDGNNLGNTPVLGLQHWTISFGSDDQDQPAQRGGVAIDPNGDVVAAGTFRKTVDFGNGPLTAASADGAVYLTKRSGVDGSSVWSRKIGSVTSGGPIASAVTTDSGGNVVLVGGYLDHEDFGGTSLHENVDGRTFLAKYDPSGNLIWVHGLGAHVLALISSLQITSTDHIVVAGNCGGGGANNLMFPDHSGNCDANPGFIAAYAPDGTFEWSRITDTGIGSVLVMPDDSINVTTGINKPTTIGDQTFVAQSRNTPIIMRLDPTGALFWATTYGAPGILYAEARAVAAADGNVISVSIASIDGADSNLEAEVRPHLVDVDASGTVEWNAEPSGRNAVPLAVAGLDSGNVIIGGEILDYVTDLGGGLINGNGFLAAYASDGTFLDARAYGEANGLPGAAYSSLATAPNGAIAFSGMISGPIDFGTGTVPTYGNGDIVIGLIDPPQ